MFNLKQHLKPESFGRHFIVLTSGTALAQFIPIIISPWLTRLFSPESLGELGIFTTTLSILCVLQTGRFESAIISEVNNYKAYHLFMNITKLIVITTVSLWLFMGLLSFFTSFLPLFNKTLWLLILPTMLAVAFTTCSQHWFNRLKFRTAIANHQILRATLNAAFSILAGIAGLKYGLIIAYSASYFLALLLVYKRSFHVFFQAKLNPKLNICVLKKHKALPMYQAPHALLNALHLAMPVYLLSLWNGLESSGYYTIAYRVVIAPTVIISSVLYQLLYVKSAENFHQKKSVLKELMIFMKWGVVIFGFIFFSLGWLSPTLFSVIFGDTWHVSGNYARILAPWIFLRSLAGPLAFMAVLANKQRQALLIELAYFIAVFLALWIGSYFGNYGGVIALSLVSSIIVLIQLSWFIRLALKLDKKTLESC